MAQVSKTYRDRDPVYAFVGTPEEVQEDIDRIYRDHPVQGYGTRTEVDFTVDKVRTAVVTHWHSCD